MKHIKKSHLVLGTLAAPAVLMAAATAQGATMDPSSAYAFKSTIPSYQGDPNPAAVTSSSGQQDARLEDANLGLPDFSSDVLESHSESGMASSHTDDIEIHPGNGYKFSSDTIRSSISGDGGTSTSLEDVKLTIGGTEVTLPSDPDANTPLSNTDLANLLQGTGISGVLNEQNGDSVNALRLSLNDFDLGGTIDPVSGDLIFGHSDLTGGGTGGATGGGTGGATGGGTGGATGGGTGGASGGGTGGASGGGTGGATGGGTGGASGGGTGGGANVPAPSGFGTMLLMALGLGGIGAAKRRQSKNKNDNALGAA